MTMTPVLTAAAERLVSLPTGFRWMPGMRDVEGRRFVGPEECAESMAETAVWLIDVAEGDEDRAAALPDLTDPATIGCVLAMVCDALDDPGFTVSGYYQDEGGYLFRADPGCINEFTATLEILGFFPSRGECLVNALAAAVGAK